MSIFIHLYFRILCVMFIILTVLGSVRGPLKNYIGWFAAEFIQCGDQINASEKTEVVWNKEGTKMDTPQGENMTSLQWPSRF